MWVKRRILKAFKKEVKDETHPNFRNFQDETSDSNFRKDEMMSKYRITSIGQVLIIAFYWIQDHKKYVQHKKLAEKN